MQDPELKTSIKRKPHYTDKEISQKIIQLEEKIRMIKPTFIILISVFSFILILTVITSLVMVFSIQRYNSKNLNSIILSQSEIQSVSDWENLPNEQKKSKLRNHYNSIVQYYTSDKPIEEKMNTEQIIGSFDELWKTTSKTSINFFLPIAYMKVATNFNPNYDIDSKKGIAALYLKTIENTVNLSIMRNDPTLSVEYRGSNTAFNTEESCRILSVKIADLMSMFNNREDWVMFALFTNEYDVFSNYWKEGSGTIPDEFYKKGAVAEALNYYYAFKGFKIPLN